MKKEISKKIAFKTIGIVISVLVICWLLIPECASCAYNYNNRDYKGICTNDCIMVPNWKLLLFSLANVNLDYKFVSNIMPKPL